MLDFNLVQVDMFTFRCVFGGDLYCDFSIYQLELFGYTNLLSLLRSCIGSELLEVKTDSVCGEFVSVRYIAEKNEIWVLVRNGFRGEFYKKKYKE